MLRKLPCGSLAILACRCSGIVNIDRFTADLRCVLYARWQQFALTFSGIHSGSSATGKVKTAVLECQQILLFSFLRKGTGTLIQY